MDDDSARNESTDTVDRRLSAWLSEGGLTALLVMLVVTLFLLPIVGPGLPTTALNVVFTVLFVTGVAALSRGRLTRILAIVAAIGAIATRWLERWDAVPIEPAGADAASVVALGVFTLLVILRTLAPGPITGYRIQGAVAAYLLIGVLFAQAFELTERLLPGSFDFAGETRPEEMSYELTYFSTVTLTTVGYGDVTPVTPEARALATFEGVVGQLYPVIILGWMVASLRTRPHD